MNKYRVTAFVLGEVQDGVAYMDEGPTKQVEAATAIQAALQNRAPRTQFWLVRKLA